MMTTLSSHTSDMELLQKRAARFGFQVVHELVCGAENLLCLDILLTERFERGGGKS
jgi:hypothetical protein